MLRRFLRDSAIYGISTVLVRGISLLLVPLYTRVLSPTDYGMVDILSVFTALAAVTVALEISQAMARFLPDTDDPEARTAIASTSLIFTLATYTAFVAVAALLSRPLAGLLLNSEDRNGVVLVALAVTWASGVFYMLQNQLRFQLRPMQYATSGMVFTLTGILFTVIFVLGLRWGVVGVLAGQAIGAGLGVGVAFAWARRLYRPLFDVARLREMLAFSLPLVPSSVGVFVTLYIDRISVKQLLSLHDLGVFGIGYRIASIVTLLMVGFQGALTPLIYAHYREPNTPGELARIFSFFVALALTVCLGLAIFAHEIIGLVAPRDYAGGAVVVPLLAPALLLSAMYIFAPGLGIAKRTGITSVINLVGAALNTALNLALIPMLGIQGSAIATATSAAVIFGWYVLLSQRHYPVPYAWSRLAVAVIGAVALYAVSTRLPPGEWLAVVAKAGLLLAAGLLFVWLRLVPVRLLRRLLGGPGSSRAPLGGTVR